MPDDSNKRRAFFTPSTGSPAEAPGRGGREGARLLFFSGGTALRDIARALPLYSKNTLHVITTFDSGGSSAELRRAFAMPAVGDLRYRIMALADRGLRESRDAYAFLGKRLSAESSRAQLQEELASFASGRHPLAAALPAGEAANFCAALREFLALMPEDFNLAGACLGNLVLAVGYLRGNRRLEEPIRRVSRLLDLQGEVCPISNTSAHLAVTLESGRVITGQHRFTGKSVPPLGEKIIDLRLCAGLDDPTPCQAELSPGLAAKIAGADLICYPVGSFYSSVLANLLPAGVGAALASNPNLKVFMPNPGPDPELVNTTVREQASMLLAKSGLPAAEGLNAILADPRHNGYPGGIPREWAAAQGIEIIDAPLFAKPGDLLLDPDLACQALLRLALRGRQVD